MSTGDLLLFIVLAPMVIPVLIISTIVRDRRKQLTWIPATGVVTSVSRRTTGSEDTSSAHLVVTYEYRDRVGRVHRGEGRLGGQELDLDSDAPVIELRLDPTDLSRSVVADLSRGAAA
ncbi:hypothetical protein GCM10023339_24650 [Alloalcanivorax gelatiniphagus]